MKETRVSPASAVSGRGAAGWRPDEAEHAADKLQHAGYLVIRKYSRLIRLPHINPHHEWNTTGTCRLLNLPHCCPQYKLELETKVHTKVQIRGLLSDCEIFANLRYKL